MSLERYTQKRRFDQTSEPSGRKGSKEDGRAFCVQRHDATRLHYDLRLEVDGVLKSWAVPKGPSLDPQVKQLAVHVEDHPMDYGSFEGNIPAGNYGAGSVMLWDTGTYELIGNETSAEQLKRGDFKFHLNGEKLRGDFALVRMKDRKTGKDGNEWLLLKKKDEFVQSPYEVDQFAWSVKTGRSQEEIALDIPVKMKKMPSSISPMLATLSGTVPAGPEWVYEIKWDGIRGMVFLEGDQVKLIGRKGNEITQQYPELMRIDESLRARSAILDGEIVVLDEKGRPRFELLQPRISAVESRKINHHVKTRPAVYFAFDLLYLDGRDLRGLPLRERQSRLQAILHPGTTYRISEQFPGNGEELLQATRQNGLEGIVAKRTDSFYESKRSQDWVKIKAVREQDFQICGFTTEGNRDLFSGLLLCVEDGASLRYVGNVGTGFDQSKMAQIYKMLSQRIVTQPPVKLTIKRKLPVTWVQPDLVARIQFLEWTEDGHLRAPVFVALEKKETVSSRKDLLPLEKEEVTLKVERRSIRLTHLNKVFYPAEGFTKRDVLNYYDAVADLLIPHWKDRPLSLRRYPDGITSGGFFQKNVEHLPDWIRTAEVQEGEDKVWRAIGDGRAQLLYFTQLGCIDQNPWMSCVESVEHPDFLLIDLDPHECSYDKIIEAAHVVRKKLESVELTGYPKTTGGDGMHIYVPLEPVYTYDQTRAFAEILARMCAAERPDLFTTPRSVARRVKDRVYFDFIQNGQGKTISAPYVLRAYPGAPVATPLEWSEVRSGLKPQQFHLKNAMARFDRVGDLFADVLTNRQRLEDALSKIKIG